MRKKSTAYTILEVLLAMGMIALLSGLVVSNIDSFFSGVGQEDLDESLFKAVREARFQSALTKDVVTLGYDAEAKAFTGFSSQGNQLIRYPVEIDGDDSIRFYSLLPLLADDRELDRQKREEVKFVRFHPDRSSTVFEVDITVGGETETHRYDAFSNLELKKGEEDE